jgi:hypothetical protein
MCTAIVITKKIAVHRWIPIKKCLNKNKNPWQYQPIDETGHTEQDEKENDTMLTNQNLCIFFRPNESHPMFWKKMETAPIVKCEKLEPKLKRDKTPNNAKGSGEKCQGTRRL